MAAQTVSIVVRGRIGPDLVAALDGFAVDADGPGMTRIVGPVPDQAKLFGLLSMFESLHIEVVSVNPVVQS
ncbi:hypothetical protein LG299_10025 [Microbacterium lacus]|uniref:hypothetical protein n=1 Tax=Microbacterium lacus TaxID=415217 RepID=UPI00384B063F